MFGLYGLQAHRAARHAGNTGHDKYSSRSKLNKKQRKRLMQQQRDLREKKRRSTDQIHEVGISSSGPRQSPSCVPAATRIGSPCLTRNSSSVSDSWPVSRDRSPFSCLSDQDTQREAFLQKESPPPPPPQQQQHGGVGGEAGMVTASLESLARLFSCVAVTRPRPYHRYAQNQAMHG